jgi:hypothetical protein
MTVRRIPAAIRAIVLLAGVVLAVVPGAFHPVPFAVTVAGVVAAVVAPRLVGSSLATAGFIIAWFAAAGWSASLPVGRTIAAAAALYVLQVSAALAACVPLDAMVERAVLVRWMRQCVVPVLAAIAVIALDEGLPQRTGAAWIELAGLAAVLLVAGAAVYAVRRRGASIARMDGRAADD